MKLLFIIIFILLAILSFSTIIMVYEDYIYTNLEGYYKEIPDGLQEATVTRIVDGDTIKVVYNNEEVYIRMIGIDTPETVHPFKPIEYFGVEASNFAKEVINKKVYLEFDQKTGKKDKYSRILAYVWIPYNRYYINYNLLTIMNGFAKPYLSFKFNEQNMLIFEIFGDYAEFEKRGMYNVF